jgi:hypothetical protein
MAKSRRLKDVISKLRDLYNRARSSKALSKILIPLSFVYPIALILLSWSELIEVNWGVFIGNIYNIVLLYFISLFVQGMGWSIIINGGFSHFFSDMEIFFKSILMRRLPGGFWHWIGRSNLYSDVKYTPKKEVSLANWIEWILIIFSGITIYFFAKEPTYIGVLLTIFYIIILYVLEKKFDWLSFSFTYGLFLFLIYFLSWSLGGEILHILINNLFQNVTFPLGESISVWSITGTISTLGFFLPSGLFIRELSLIALLENYLVYSEVILLGLVIRIIFLVCDIVISLLCMILFQWLSNKLDEVTGD